MHLYSSRSAGRCLGAKLKNGFALTEALIALALFSMLLGCVFTAEAQVMRLLREGKQSTYATELMQERFEQLRSGLWESVTDPVKLSSAVSPATATATNLPGVSERITVEPLVNPDNLRVTCARSAAGEITSAGLAISQVQSVKLTMSVQWRSYGRLRQRGMVTILTNGGI